MRPLAILGLWSATTAAGAGLLLTVALAGGRTHAPAKVRIAGQDWRVTHGVYDPTNLGEMECDNLEIRLDKGLPPDKEAEILLHELEHSAYCNLAVDGELRVSEEEHVKLTAPWLLMILRDNPEVVDFLVRTEGAESGARVSYTEP